MQVTMSKNEKIIFDILINDIDVLDALNIVIQYAALTNIRINEDKHARDERTKDLMKQKRAEPAREKNQKGSPITVDEFIEDELIEDAVQRWILGAH
jgi:hypothetical protein